MATVKLMEIKFARQMTSRCKWRKTTHAIAVSVRPMESGGFVRKFHVHRETFTREMQEVVKSKDILLHKKLTN